MNRTLLLHSLRLALLLGAIGTGRLPAQPCFEGGTCCFDPDPGTITRFCESDADLFGALGIYWSADQEGIGAETGVHLRWTFDSEQIGFPAGGFEVQRRAPGAHQFDWRPLGPRIYPATTEAIALSRIPAILTADERCAYENGAADLLELLQLAYCTPGEENESYWWFEDDSQIYRESEIPPEKTSGDDAPLGFEFQPLDFTSFLASDPVIARILGLYLVDRTADPTVRYDYRIIAHYRDRPPLCALVYDVGEATTDPLDDASPVNAAPASIDDVIDVQTSENDSSEVWVELDWRHQTGEILLAAGRTPEEGLRASDGITPLRYLILRKTTGESLDFERISLGDPDENGCPLFVAPVIISSDTDGSDRFRGPFRAPPYFRDTRVETGQEYRYRVHGIDIFGRFSPEADSGPVTVEDIVPPPPPIVTEARFFQLEDPELERLPLAERKAIRATVAHSSPRSSVVLRVRWLWPEKFRTSHPDLDGFDVLVDTTTVETVAGDDATDQQLLPNPEPGTCADGIDNDGDGRTDLLDSDCGISVGGGIIVIPSLAASEDGDGFPAERADLFERYIAIHPSVAEAPISDLDPVNTISFHEIGVRSVDLDGNASLGENYRTRKAALRDLTPPDAPPPPELLLEPGAPDVAGNVSLKLGWTTLPNLSYRLYRVSQETLCDALVASGTPVPSCSTLPDEDLQGFAGARPDLLDLLTAAPVGPFSSGSAVHFDSARGDIANRYVYSLRATDPAGNQSDYSTPGEPIFLPDRLPPARPVITSGLARTDGGTGQVVVSWLRGREEDIALYRLYRTDDERYLGSKRKMALVVETSDFAAEYSFTDTPARPERLQRYRLEAVDTSGNHSLLSETAVVRTVDTIPPDLGGWDFRSRWSCLAGTSGVEVRVTAPATATDEFRVLYTGGSGAALPVTGWIAGSADIQDPGRDWTASQRYRIEVRDQAGNKTGLTRVLPAATDDPCSKSRPVLAVASSPFIRGDADASGTVNLGDAIFLLESLFRGGAVPPCRDAADADASGRLEITDATTILGHLFRGGRSGIPAPFPACGRIPGSLTTPGSSLGCDRFPPCAGEKIRLVEMR